MYSIQGRSYMDIALGENIPREFVHFRLAGSPFPEMGQVTSWSEYPTWAKGLVIGTGGLFLLAAGWIGGMFTMYKVAERQDRDWAREHPSR